MATERTVGRSASASAAIRLMEQAAQANLCCRYRVGALIELPASGEVMITGDLHGDTRNFLALVNAADLWRNEQRHLILQEVVHEELAEREDISRSHQLVERAARLKATFPDRVHLLMSNHEFAELNDLPIAKRGKELNELFEEGLRRAYGDRWQEVREAYKKFWRSLPLAAVTGGGAFISHSTPSLRHMAGITREYLRQLKAGEGLTSRDPSYHLLWGRDYSKEAAEKFAAQVGSEILIVAHSPCEEGYALPNERHLILDCSGTQACYLILPNAAPMTQQQAAMRIRRLAPSRVQEHEK